MMMMMIIPCPPGAAAPVPSDPPPISAPLGPGPPPGALFGMEKWAKNGRKMGEKWEKTWGWRINF